MNARTVSTLAFFIPVVVWACQDQPTGTDDLSPLFETGQRGPPSDVCSAPPDIRQIVSRPMTEPPPGEFNTGTFRLVGNNFQQGDIFVDGPLVVFAPARVNRAGTLIAIDWSIGCCAPEPGLFNVFVDTPCGLDQIEFPISGKDVTPDNDPPAFGALNPAPIGSPGTDAVAIVMTIGETIWDENIISQATLSVLADGTDANGSGADGTCDIATDYWLNPGSGEIDQNAVDLTNGTNTITYNESFTIARPPAPVNPVFYCFWVNAQDEAGNSDSLSTAVFVTWNP